MKPKLIYLLILTWFLGNMATHLVNPSLPIIKQEFAISATLAKYIISIFLLTKAISILFIGPLAERFGRRIISLFGLSFYFTGSLLGFFSHHIDILFIARLLQGIGTGATVLMGHAMINDVFNAKGATKAFSKVFFTASIIITLLPMLGGFIVAGLGWHASFLTMALYSAIIFVVFYRFLPETQAPNPHFSFSPLTALKNYSQILRQPIFIGYVFCSILMIAGESAFNTASSFLFISHYHISTSYFGILMTSLTIGHLIGTLLCGKLVDRYSLPILLGFGVISMLLAGIILVILTSINLANVSGMVLAMIIYYLGTGFIMTVAAAGSVQPFPNLIATAASLAMFLKFFCSGMSSMIVSHLSIKSAEPLALFILTLACCAVMIWYFAVMRGHPHNQDRYLASKTGTT